MPHITYLSGQFRPERRNQPLFGRRVRTPPHPAAAEKPSGHGREAGKPAIRLYRRCQPALEETLNPALGAGDELENAGNAGPTAPVGRVERSMTLVADQAPPGPPPPDGAHQSSLPAAVITVGRPRVHEPHDATMPSRP